MKRNKLPSCEYGGSLMESLLVVVIIGIVVFLMANIPNSIMLINKSKHISLAREIAVKQIEDKRAIGYTNLSLGNTVVNDSRLLFLPQGTGTVITGVESGEDQWQDCDESVCANDERVKQVKVIINWKDNNKQQSLTLETLVGEGGIN